MLPEHLKAKFAVAESGCWLWTGWSANGYGLVAVRGRTRMAHRVVYEAVRGPIPGGLQLDHLCCIKGCVNPDHLEPVTAAENQRRAAAQRVRRTATTCHLGHPLDGVRTRTKGGRYCKTCNAINRRKSRATAR
jgi:hypothetical protein